MKNCKIIFKKNLIGQWRWKIISSNGKCIASSNESFFNKKDCEHNLQITAQAINNLKIK